MEQAPLQSTPSGAIRFNTDSSKLEYYDGNQWVNITSTSPEAQTGGTRALFAGGLDPGNSDVIDYITIPIMGNTTDFGDLTEARQAMGGCASRTRALQLGGYTSSFEDVIDYEDIATSGNATDFGDASTISQKAATSNAHGGL